VQSSTDSAGKSVLEEDEEERRRLRRVVYWQRRLHLQKLKRDEGGLLGAIDELDRRIVDIHRKLTAMEKQATQFEQQIKQAHRQWQTEHQIAKQMLKQIQPRLFLLYRMERLGQARLMLDAKSLHNLALRWRALQLISSRDIQTLIQYQKMRHRALIALQEWHRRRDKQHELIRNTQQQRQKLADERKERAYALQALYREVHLYRSALRELQSSSQHLQVIVSEWQSDTPIGSLSLLRGQLTWPVLNYSPYCDQYELKRDGSFIGLVCQKHRTKPMDLQCKLGRGGISLPLPEGTPVLSIADGRVASIGWQRGYGQIAIVDHGQDFYSLYAHLSQIVVQKDQQVRSQQPIGLSGSTGTLDRSQLYFEIRRRMQVLPAELWLSTPSQK
jgi:murein DD-endopeptidase MepM/ murein hydrolase activator NlpD